MSSDRDNIFAAIKEALAPLSERAPYPEWDDSLIVCQHSAEYESLVDHFVDKLQAASGRFYQDVRELTAYLVKEGSTFGYCDPELAPIFEGCEGISFDTEFDEAKINDYSFGITKGDTAIAESGTIMLKDGKTSARLGALAPWIHIAVIDPADVVATIGEAILRFGDDPSIVFATGPSKTADVEGILIEGVHGPGIQIALIL